MKALKIFLVFLLLAIIVIQFFPVEKNVDTSTKRGEDFAAMYDVPPQIQQTLQTSCYDCHSNNTTYEWYHRVQPVAWYVQDHINEGKDELNFDAFGSYSDKRKKHKLEESAELVEEGEMPLTSYTFIHPKAKLKAEERENLAKFFKELVQKEERRQQISSN